MSLFLEHQKTHVKNVLASLIQFSKEVDHHHDSPPSQLIGFMFDIACSSMIDMAYEFGVPTYMFSTMSLGFIKLLFHLQTLHDEHNIDLTELTNDSEVELVLPSFANVVPSSVLPIFVTDHVVFSFFLNQLRNIGELAKGFIINTSIELESHVISSMFNASLPTIYLVGPILNVVSDDDDNNDRELIKWLDDQPTSSTVFLCFRNMGASMRLK
ncbi:anthocyanidin 3-O-glucosyltransferase 6 [Ziziphus jujuba]|uniref:Anthocyanidin 3-O-glucosyltransferase 6 n=2 Tax=Ziziphus jujuba TaxID=326968 RepID=A0A6P6G414_ZIZJJ|nr:anthocyanidin 3-O-glucosyltransferase 6 [Ziziphus jujuba]KAH7533291.1 hypothetical protein FEM48_Zijuj04G0115200 [Ziziphus jujuba var. spinosa]